MSKEITIKNHYDIDKPVQVASMAKALKAHVIQNELFTRISDKNYVHVDGWQFAGALLGTYPIITEVIDLSSKDEMKWKAVAEVIDRATGKVVSRGFSVCSNKETKKKSFDEFAILSMAQTRAIGKAYRNVIGWVMKLAGYESTPSEDMMKVGEVPPPPAPAKPTAKDEITGFECAVGAEPISKAEFDFSKRVYGKPLCRTHQKSAKRKS